MHLKSYIEVLSLFSIVATPAMDTYGGGLAQRTLGVVPWQGFGLSLRPLEASGVGGWGIVHVHCVCSRIV